MCWHRCLAPQHYCKARSCCSSSNRRTGPILHLLVRAAPLLERLFRVYCTILRAELKAAQRDPSVTFGASQVTSEVLLFYLRCSWALCCSMAADSAENDSSNNVVGAAVRGGGLLMLLAFLQRASTFCLNILLQRSMMGSKDFAAYGAARYLSISRTCLLLLMHCCENR